MSAPINGVATRNPAEELRRLLSDRTGEKHVVAIQDFPDPDAISSAVAYREIASCFDISVDILYEGLISHPENLALVNLLEIDITRFAESLDWVGLDAYPGTFFPPYEPTLEDYRDDFGSFLVRDLAPGQYTPVVDGISTYTLRPDDGPSGLDIRREEKSFLDVLGYFGRATIGRGARSVLPLLRMNQVIPEEQAVIAGRERIHPRVRRAARDAWADWWRENRRWDRPGRGP